MSEVPDLLTALRTTGATREFTDEPVDGATLHRILDTARFAPSGGNRQGWRVVVVESPDVRRALRDLYLPGWYEYLAIRGAGLTPWAPITDRDAEAVAAVLALGHPVKQHRRLTRDPVDAFTTVDRYDGEAFTG